MNPLHEMSWMVVSCVERDGWGHHQKDSIQRDHWFYWVWPVTSHTLAVLWDFYFQFQVEHFTIAGSCCFSSDIKLPPPSAQNCSSSFLWLSQHSLYSALSYFKTSLLSHFFVFAWIIFKLVHFTSLHKWLIMFFYIFCFPLGAFCVDGLPAITVAVIAVMVLIRFTGQCFR